MISSATMLVAGLAVFAGYLIFGVTGFGASPITIPVLVHVLPLAFVLPLAAAHARQRALPHHFPPIVPGRSESRMRTA